MAHAREIQNMKDGWEFTKANCKVQDAYKPNKLRWSKVTLPHTWNDKDTLADGNYYYGPGCYRKKITIPATQKGKRFFLRFEGVGQVADVYVNNVHVGSHQGAYAAFCFEITKQLKLGQENTIFVHADNTPRKDIIPINHFLFPVYGGIYRPVSLITTDAINITPTDYASPGVFIRQNKVSKTKAQITVKTKLTNAHSNGQTVQLTTTVRDKDGKVVAKASKDVFLRSTVMSIFDQKLTIDHPTLWHGRRNPYLYQVKVEISQNGKTLDSVTQPLGLRYYRIDKDKGFILNDEPYRLYGVSRHQDWQGYGSALSAEQHKIDCDLMYEMGCTSLRLAHYQQAEEMYANADKMGFLIWAEVPFVNRFSGKEGENAKLQLLELIRQNYNHPSIFVWGLHNEVYASQQDWFPVLLTEQLHNLAKSEDPDRFTVSTSGFGLLTRPIDCRADLMGSNRYFGWYYGKSQDIGEWADNTRKVRPDNPVCVAEYGCGGNIYHQQYHPKQPAARAPFFPEQFHALQHEIQWQQLKPRRFIWASYIWNMFDFSVPRWNRGGIKARNHKGLITFDRKHKKDAFYFYKANWSKDPVLHLTSKRLKKINLNKIEIKAYSNFDTVTLKVNGKVIGTRKANDVRVFTWSDVALKEGENQIEISAGDQKKWHDSTTLTYDPNMKRRELDQRRKLIKKGFDVVLASEEDQKNIAEYAVDNNPATRWSAKHKGAWLRLDLSKEQTLDSISIQWFKGKERKYQFSIAYSTDGNSWIQIFSGKSSGKSNLPEKYSFPTPVKTRYIRIKGNGSNVNPWTNISEVVLP